MRSVWSAVTALLMGHALVCCGRTTSAAEEVIPIALEAFDLNQVRLLDGPCQLAQEANRRYLHALDSDRLLRNFRLNAALPAPGEPLGGWEKPDCELRGHFVGHYLSACALMYRSTGDEELKAKADAMVAELAKCQQALGGEYLSAFPESFWDRLESRKNVPWAPYYTIHKIMAGMFDMYHLCGNQQALDVLKGMAAYFKQRIDTLPVWQMDRVLETEFGGMSEVLHNLYSVTNDPDHLELAHAFDQAEFLGPLALEHDNLSRIHANTQVPKICGAARRYELTGDERYRTITRYFWDRVVHTRSYATGGSTSGERWPDPNKLADTLAPNNQECCVTHNMLKVTRHLIRWTGDPQYADYYERAYFNGILGTQNPETGMLMYYVPLATGHTKNFSTPNDSFWCCCGTGIESFAKLGDSIYFHDEDGIYVNLFIACEVNWPEKGVRLEQQTSFPEQEASSLIVHCQQPTELALHIHIPYWATEGVEAKLNGKRRKVQAKPTSYLTIEREWKDGDTVEVRLPMSLHVHPMPDDPELVAIMYGPLVLAGLPAEGRYSPQAGLTEQQRYFLADADDLDSWITPVQGQPLTFETTGQPTDLTLIPLNRIIDQPYGVYWIITQEGSERHRQIQAAEQARRRREARIVDRVIPGDDAAEQAHNLQGERTSSGPFGGRHWRHAGNGWWSWDLKVLPDVQMTLVCTYWGSDRPPRTFDILVDGQKIATQSLDHNQPGEFFDVAYPIPEQLTKGKQRITVRFQAHPDNTAGGVFDCATLKPE